MRRISSSTVRSGVGPARNSTPQTGEPLDDRDYEEHLKDTCRRRTTRNCCSTSSKREEMDCREDRRARSAGHHRRSAEVGDQPVAGFMECLGRARLEAGKAHSDYKHVVDAHRRVPSCSQRGCFRARIALRNPPLNVIDIPMMEELAHFLAEIESRPEFP